LEVIRLTRGFEFFLAVPIAARWLWSQVDAASGPL
jgi:hypothetical protein